MDDPNHVPVSVAEWKGYTKCKRCDEREGGEGYDHPGRGTVSGVSIPQMMHGITPVRCLQIRALLLDGHSRNEAADVLDVSKRTAGRHGIGRCQCDHGAQAVTYTDAGYEPDGDGGLPTLLSGTTKVTAEVCDITRRVLIREDVRTAHLAALFDVSQDSVRRHASGKCTHTTVTRPATFDPSAGKWVQE